MREAARPSPTALSRSTSQGRSPGNILPYFPPREGRVFLSSGCTTQLWALGLWDTGISFRLQGWIHSTKAAKPAHHPNG